MNKLNDNTPLAMLTVGDLKKMLSVDKILGDLPSVQQMPSEIMNIDEVATLTGYSKKTIYKFTSQKAIPFHKPAHGGRRLYFIRAEILEWMQAQTIQTTEQYCEEAINNISKHSEK